MIIDECLNNVSNRFELVRVLSERVKQLNKGMKPLVELKNEKNILVAIREIAEKKVFKIENEQIKDEE